MSKTAAPAQAAWYATEAPTMPAPTTTTSVPGEPRTRDRIPDGNNCPSGRSPYGTPVLLMRKAAYARRLVLREPHGQLCGSRGCRGCCRTAAEQELRLAAGRERLEQGSPRLSELDLELCLATAGQPRNE